MWSEYLTESHDKLLARLASIQENLATFHTELAFAKQRELEAKSSAWDNSMEQSVTGRERDARLAATPHTLTILDLEGKKAALEEEKSWVQLLIHSQ